MITIFSTALGNFLLEEVEGQICRLTATKEPVRGTSPLAKETRRQLNEYFQGERREFQLPYRFAGTPFQEKAWNALTEIPYGETRSYGEIAKRIGEPKAARAVGGAIHKNPIQILIPCHRVIGSTGNLIGFAAGLSLKKALLSLEGGHATCAIGNIRSEFPTWTDLN